MGVRSSDHQLVAGKQYFEHAVQIEGAVQGLRKEVITATTGQALTPEQSGATVILSDNVLNVALPTPEVGLNYKFILTADMGSNTSTVKATSDGSSAANLFTGIVDVNGSPTSTVDKDVITFANAATEGDYCEVTCVGTGTSSGNPTWHYFCFGDASGAITVA